MADKGAPAPAPDPRIGDAAVRQAQLGEEWLAFTKDQFAVSKERQAQIDAATKGFVDLAEGYDTPERRTAAAAEAKADVSSSMAAQRDAANRRAAAVGIAPDSGRFAGINRAADLTEGLGSVDAQNRARKNVEATGIALKGDALNALSGANQQFNASTGIVNAGFSGAGNATANSASTLSNLYSDQLNKWKADQEQANAGVSGIGTAVGAGLGLILSSKKAKKNRKPVKEGEALKAVDEMPVDTYDYKEGMGDGGSHVGPMAEDFQRATGSGDGTTIPVQDALGITMRAVQDLSKKMDRIEGAVGIGALKKAA